MATTRGPAPLHETALTPAAATLAMARDICAEIAPPRTPVSKETKEKGKAKAGAKMHQEKDGAKEREEKEKDGARP